MISSSLRQEALDAALFLANVTGLPTVIYRGPGKNGCKVVAAGIAFPSGAASLIKIVRRVDRPPD